MFSFFCCFSLSELVTFNESYLNDDESAPVIVYSYLSNIDSIKKQVEKDFSILNRASEIFPGIKFVALDCSQSPDICRKNFLEPNQAINLFHSFHRELFHHKDHYHGSHSLEFTNENSLFALIEFIESNTHFKSNIEIKKQSFLAGNNFSDFVKSHEYSAVFFTDRNARMSSILIPTINEISDSFKKDKNIGVAEVLCSDVIDFCVDQGVESGPTLRIYKGESNYSEYKGTREFPFLIDFINKECHSYRTSEARVNISLFLDKCSNDVIAKLEKGNDSLSKETIMKLSEECGENSLIHKTVKDYFDGKENDSNKNYNDDENEVRKYIFNKLSVIKATNEKDEL